MMQSDVTGFPCPKCNDPKHPQKRIKTTLLQFVMNQEASCEFCGLKLNLVMDEAGKRSVSLATDLNKELSNNR